MSSALGHLMQFHMAAISITHPHTHTERDIVKAEAAVRLGQLMSQKANEHEMKPTSA